MTNVTSVETRTEPEGRNIDLNIFIEFSFSHISTTQDLQIDVCFGMDEVAHARLVARETCIVKGLGKRVEAHRVTCTQRTVSYHGPKKYQWSICIKVQAHNIASSHELRFHKACMYTQVICLSIIGQLTVSRWKVTVLGSAPWWRSASVINSCFRMHVRCRAVLPSSSWSVTDAST